MSRLRSPRVLALAVVVAVLAVGGVAFALGTGGSHEGVSLPETTVPSANATSRSTTTTTTTALTTTTTTRATRPSGPRPDDGVLESGDRGPEVVALQKRLAELHFDAGVPDGSFGLATMYAVEGFQNLAGMRADGKVGPQVAAALAHPPAVTPLVPGGEPTRVEVDKSRQLLFLWINNDLRLITHVSTGSGKTYCVKGDCNNKAITPDGAFRFMWRYSGWRESRLGKLYNPVYFTGSGVAVHGAPSVPTYPASHGCVRIPMHISEYFPSLVKRGDAVYVLSGPGAHVGAPPARSTPTGPPPTDPPTSPDSSTSSTSSTTSTTTTSTTSTTTTSTTTSTTTPTSTTSITTP